MADNTIDVAAFRKKFPQYANWTDKQIENLATASKANLANQDIEESEYAPADEEFNREAGTDIKGKRIELPKPNYISLPSPQSEYLTPNPEFEKNVGALAKSVAHGGSDIMHGITGPIMESLPESTGWPQGSREFAERRAREQELLREEYPKTELAGNILGKGLVTSPLAVALAPAAGASFIPRAGSNALTGLLSGLAEYGPLKHRLEQSIYNAGGGLLFPELLRGPGKALSASTAKLYNFLGNHLPKKAQEIINYGAEHNVPVYAPDVVHQASKIAKAGRLSEKTILNTVDKRIAQQEAAQKAAKRSLAKAKKAMKAESYGGAAGMEEMRQIVHEAENALSDIDMHRFKTDEIYRHKVETFENNLKMLSELSENYKTKRLELGRQLDAIQDKLNTLKNSNDPFTLKRNAQISTKLHQEEDKILAQIEDLKKSYPASFEEIRESTHKLNTSIKSHKKNAPIAAKPEPNKRAKAAKKLINDIEEGGDDWNQILKNSGNMKLLQNKIKADELYNHVSDLAKRKGKIDLSDTITKLDGMLANLKKFPETNKDAIRSLTNIRRDLTKTIKGKEASTLVNAQGKPIVEATASKEVAKKLTFDEAREIRSTINDVIADYYAGKNTLVGKKGVQYLMRLQNSLEGDIEHFATHNGPELKNAWKEADRFYKENIIPFKDLQLAKALKAESNPDEIFKMFIKSGGAENDFGTGRALKFYKALDAKGQAAVRYGMLKNAVERATDETGNFSLAKFATTLEKLKASRAVFFKGAQKHEIDGLAKLMRHVQRAGQVTPPETGVQTIGYLMFGSLAKLSYAAPAAAAGTLGASFFLNKMLTTPKGRNFLLAASRLPANSPKWTKLLDGIGEFMEQSGFKLGQAASKNTKAVTREVSEKVSGATGYGKNKEEK